jgi:hypothetical protein
MTCLQVHLFPQMLDLDSMHYRVMALYAEVVTLMFLR